MCVSGIYIWIDEGRNGNENVSGAIRIIYVCLRFVQLRSRGSLCVLREEKKVKKKNKIITEYDIGHL